MSANDGISISKSTFEVIHYDADGGYNDLIGTGKNLEDAIEIAEKYDKEEMFPVEYGISFIN